ncbi:MAG: preprotein translocase subunit YajC [Gemmataceae bacterium]
MRTLFAQDPKPADPAAATPAGGGATLPMLMFVLMGAFFLIVVLPQNRRAKREQAAMLSSVKRGSKVVTSAGIIGTVVGLKDTEDEMTIRSEDAKIKVLKSSIVRVLGQDESEAK